MKSIFLDDKIKHILLRTLDNEYFSILFLNLKFLKYITICNGI